MKAIGRAIIVLDTEENVKKTSSGLILDKKNREDIRYVDAEIVLVGNLASEFLKPGDKVKIDKHAGHGVEIDNIKYKVLKLDDIVIVL